MSLDGHYLSHMAHVVFTIAFPDAEWPNFAVAWWKTRSKRTYGKCVYSHRVILLNVGMAEEHGRVICTLIHEFIHALNPKLKHGAKFNRIENEAYDRFFGLDHDQETSRDKGARLRREHLLRREERRQHNLGILADALRRKGVDDVEISYCPPSKSQLIKN